LKKVTDTDLESSATDDPLLTNEILLHSLLAEFDCSARMGFGRGVDDVDQGVTRHIGGRLDLKLVVDVEIYEQFWKSASFSGVLVDLTEDSSGDVVVFGDIIVDHMHDLILKARDLDIVCDDIQIDELGYFRNSPIAVCDSLSINPVDKTSESIQAQGWALSALRIVFCKAFIERSVKEGTVEADEGLVDFEELPGSCCFNYSFNKDNARFCVSTMCQSMTVIEGKMILP
jgi:hypothetical protein